MLDQRCRRWTNNIWQTADLDNTVTGFQQEAFNSFPFSQLNAEIYLISLNLFYIAKKKEWYREDCVY